MKERSAAELTELASDIEAELTALSRLEGEIQRVVGEVRADPARYPEVWRHVRADVSAFTKWLRALATHLSED